MKTIVRDERAKKFIDDFRKDDVNVQVLWEMKGPKNTSITYITMYLIGLNLLVVHEYDGGGFQTFPSIPSNSIDETMHYIKALWGMLKEPTRTLGDFTDEEIAQARRAQRT